MTTMRERVLSEFIDAWNDGRRPDVHAYLERVDATERDALADDIATFLTWAPEPDYDDAALAGLEAEPIVAEAMAAAGGHAGLWPSLIPRLRKRAQLSVGDLAGRLAETLALPSAATPKTATYLTQMEHGELDPSRVSRRLLTALGSVLGIDGQELEAAGGLRGWAMPAAPARRGAHVPCRGPGRGRGPRRPRGARRRARRAGRGVGRGRRAVSRRPVRLTARRLLR